MSMEHTVGIDFGTISTRIARWDSSRKEPVLVRLRPAHGDDFPTAIHLGESGVYSYGDDAIELGRYEAEGYKRNFKIDLDAIREPYRLGTRSVTAQDLTAKFLGHLKTFVEEESLHASIERTILTVPAMFGALGRQAISTAAERAGLPQIAIVDEEVAVALALKQFRPELWPQKNLLLLSWGGYALSLAVVRLESDYPQIPPDLLKFYPAQGGESIDRHLLREVSQRLVGGGRSSLKQRTLEEFEFARRKIVEWKHRYHKRPNNVWSLDGLGFPKGDPAGRWTSAELKFLVDEHIEKTVQSCVDLVARAEKRLVEIDGILLTGGTSEIDGLTEMLARRLPQAPVIRWELRLSATALGALLFAHAGSRDKGRGDFWAASDPTASISL